MFKNGHGSEGVEIVADPEKFEDVSKFCPQYDNTSKVSMLRKLLGFENM